MPKPTPSPPTVTAEFSTYISANRGLVRDIEYDSAGNIYVTGGTPQLDTSIITPGNDYFVANGTVDHGRFTPHDVFVQKYDASGGLIWTTRIGGVNYDRAYALEVDDQGGVFVAGRAGSDFYTTAGVIQETFGGNTLSTQNLGYGPQDSFVSKLDATTGQVDWSTYFGGASGEIIRDFDIGPDGVIHIAQTFVKDEAGQHITADAMQPHLSGTTDDIYAQLSSDGSTLLYGTFIGGDNDIAGKGGQPSIKVDANGDINIVTQIDSSNAPTTTGAYSDTLLGEEDLYLVKLDGADGGRSLKAATYFGTSGRDILETHDLAVDDAGNFIVVGESTGADLETSKKSFQPDFAGGGTDGIIAKISADGTTVLASSYFGGTGRDNIEGIVLTDDGIYVTGLTDSTDLPVTDTSTFGGYSGGTDAFVVRFSADLKSIDYASYVGGSNAEQGRAIAVSDTGQVTLGGFTESADYPVLNAEDSMIWAPRSPMLTSFTITGGDSGGGGNGNGGGGGNGNGGGGGNGNGGGKGGGKPSTSTSSSSQGSTSNGNGNAYAYGYGHSKNADKHSYKHAQDALEDLADLLAVIDLSQHGGSSNHGGPSGNDLYMVIADNDGDGVYSLQMDDIWAA